MGLMYVALALVLEDLQALKMGLNPAAVVLVLMLADLQGLNPATEQGQDPGAAVEHLASFELVHFHFDVWCGNVALLGHALGLGHTRRCHLGD